MFWLLLLAVATFLGIVVRRLLLRQNPLMDELYSKNVAIEHVRDGVAWVNARGSVDYANPALAKMLDTETAHLHGRSWYDMFAPEDRARVQHAYSQMLLSGKTSVEARLIGSQKPRSLSMVAVHDHKMRLAGHHCILHPLPESRTDDLGEPQLAYAAN
jgi:PAS domain S-box-containing protein